MNNKSLLTYTSLLMACHSSALFAHDLHYYAVEDIAAPFQITTEGAEHKGIISDIVDKLSSNLSLELETTTAPSPRVEKLLANNDRLDENWIAYDSPAWNSIQNSWMFSEPLFTAKHSILHCGHAHADKLDGHSLAILKHFRYPRLEALAEQGKVELIQVHDYEQGFKLVELGRVDGFVEMDIRLRFNFLNYDEKGDCTRIDSIGNAEDEYDLYLVVNKNIDDELKKRLDKGYAKLKKSGFVQKTIEKYTHSK